MKRSAIALVACVLASAVAAQEAPNLVGTWTGKMQGIGMMDGWGSGDATLTVSEQRGPAFKGYVSYPEGEGKTGRSEFVGAIALDGKTVRTADSDGTTSGFLIDPNTFEQCYVEAGADAKVACTRFTRQR